MLYGISLSDGRHHEGHRAAPRRHGRDRRSISWSTCRRANASASLRGMHAEFWWYILVFGILAFLTVFVGIVARRRRRSEMRDDAGNDPHRPWARPRSAVAHPAAQRTGPAPTEAGASGGAFRPEGLGARLKGLFRGDVSDGHVEGARGPAAARRRRARPPRPTSSSASAVRTTTARTPRTCSVTRCSRSSATRSRCSSATALTVVLVVGVNGSGKTTTIGKLAKRLVHEGRSVSLAAADTFRAAAGEQLEVWARTSGAHVVGQERGADPGAVAFDAVKSADGPRCRRADRRHGRDGCTRSSR